MKIGYPVINQGLGHISSHTFRLAALDRDQLLRTVSANLDSLERTLAWNVERGLMFYRMGSGLVPFASHTAMDIDWQSEFAPRLAAIGAFIRDHDVRTSMHPGQYVVINSPNDSTYAGSVRELQYHADVMDMMGLDATHKIQFHLGGLHGDREASTATFIERYNALPEAVRRRLVIENDERVASSHQCVEISRTCGIPVLFDTLHHEVNNHGETILAGLKQAAATWQANDGVPMVDYSSQNPDKKTGAHALTLDVEKFRSFARSLKGLEIDIMFEIKNKEASALQAQIVLGSL